MEFNWTLVTAEKIKANVEKIKLEYTRVADLISKENKEPTFENTILPLLNVADSCQFLVTECRLPSKVSPIQETFDAAIAAKTELEEFFITWSTRRDVYEAFKRYMACNEKVNEFQTKVIRKLDQKFRQAGMELDNDKFTKLQVIKKRLSELGIQYNTNLNRENSTYEFTLEELRGLPVEYLKGKEKDGKYVFTLRYPDFYPIVENVLVEQTRKTMYTANWNRCADTNTSIMNEVIRLRHEMANLLGYSNYAEYTLGKNRMANLNSIEKLYESIVPQVKKAAQVEIKTLLALKQQDEKSKTDIYPWDILYYTKKNMENELKFDPMVLCDYFDMKTVTNGLFEIYERLLGLRFVEEETKNKWHEDVKLYQVHDQKSKNLVGFFYTDLHPRKNKYGHACHSSLAYRVVNPDGTIVLPIGALICNFSQTTGLRFKEVVTYFHEFGHAMHHICCESVHSSYAMGEVEWDFIEAPSQMLEYWCYEKEALVLLSKHKDTGKPIPDDLIEKIQKSRQYENGALHYARQSALGITDLRLHTSYHKELPRKVWEDTYFEMMGIRAIDKTNCMASFSHIMNGYAAGYYGYLWSEVYAADMFYSKFKKEGILNPKTGQEYRYKILAPAGKTSAFEQLWDFLGRDTDPSVFTRQFT